MCLGGLIIDDMDVFEPNEAFVSPVLAFCIEFGLDFDDPRINPTGEASAIGHIIMLRLSRLSPAHLVDKMVLLT